MSNQSNNINNQLDEISQNDDYRHYNENYCINETSEEYETCTLLPQNSFSFACTRKQSINKRFP